MDKNSGSPVEVPSSGSGSPSGLKQSLDSEAQSTAPRKVGIVVRSLKEKEEREKQTTKGDYRIKLFMVEIDDSESAIGMVDPVADFKFEYFASEHAVCVWRSYIYVFWGSDYELRHPPQRGAKKADLSKANDYCQVTEDELVPIQDMKYPKIYPIALPTPDGKRILVFGNVISVGQSHTCFELYDPERDSWEQVPGLDLNSCHCDCDCQASCYCIEWIKFYTFVDDNHFLLKLKRRAFALDLIRKEWTFVDIPDVYRICGYVLTAKNQYCLTPGGAFQLENGDFLSTGRRFRPGTDFPLPNFYDQSWKDDEYIYKHPSILPLHPFIQEGEGDGQVCNTCILHVKSNKYSGELDSESVANLSLDVCRTELPSLQTRLSNSLTLKIGFSYSFRSLFLVSV